MRVAYFFSGTKRRASIGECLAVLCRKAGIGLVMHEVDTMVGGKAHNLLDKAAQADWLSRIHDGDFDMCIHSPPCASWSRAPFSDDKPPQPVRNKAHPWGIPWLLKGRAGEGTRRERVRALHLAGLGDSQTGQRPRPQG